jgi:hypothetical protein
MLSEAAASNAQSIAGDTFSEHVDLPLSWICPGTFLTLKDPPALDAVAFAALRAADPRIRAQQLAVLAQKAKASLTLEVKDAAALVQQDGQQPRRFQVVRVDIAKTLFQDLQAPLITAKLPTHKETLNRAQLLYAQKHPGKQVLPEAELTRQGYTAKAQTDLITVENVKAKQISGHVEALRAELGRFGFTLLPAM